MAGQVKHVKLFSGVDARRDAAVGAAAPAGEEHRRAHRRVADVLQEHGITLMDSTALLADLMAQPGVLTAAAPDEAMQARLRVRLSRRRRHRRRLDVGQTDRRQGPRGRRRRGDGRHRRGHRARRRARRRRHARREGRQALAGHALRRAGRRRRDDRGDAGGGRRRAVDRRRQDAVLDGDAFVRRRRRGGHRRGRPGRDGGMRPARCRRVGRRSASATSAGITRGCSPAMPDVRPRRAPSISVDRARARGGRRAPRRAGARRTTARCSGPRRRRRRRRADRDHLDGGAAVSRARRPRARREADGRRRSPRPTSCVRLADALGRDAGGRAHRAVQPGDSGGAADSAARRASSRSTG